MAAFTSEEEAIGKMPSLEFGPADVTVELLTPYFECVDFLKLTECFIIFRLNLVAYRCGSGLRNSNFLQIRTTDLHDVY
jgi:hypothetical protein